MKVVDATERFVSRNWPEGSVRDPAKPPPEYGFWEPCAYTCPDCSYQVDFTRDDFSRHVLRPLTNLSPGDAEAATIAVGDRRTNDMAFVDFYCPKCRLPVRVYYRHGVVGWDWGVSLVWVVEGEHSDEAAM